MFQANPVTGDKRISGTAASLLGFSDHGRAPGDDTALARLFVASAIVYGWGGIPVIWSGDELGMTNDPHWADEPGHADDNRWAHRPRLDWQLAGQRHDRSTSASTMFEGVAHLARVGAALHQLPAAAETTVLMHTDAGVLAVVRSHPSGPMVCVYNVTDSWRFVRLPALRRRRHPPPTRRHREPRRLRR